MSLSVFQTNRKIDNNYALNIDIDSSTYCINELLQMDVPIEYQDDDFSCTPVCMLMVLKYIKEKFTSGFPDLSLSEISKAIKTSADEGGTTFENIEKINELFNETSPSLEIVPDFRHKFEDIVEEVKKNNRPVIAWVLMPDPNAPYEHAIVITDVDEDKLLIYANDPVYGRQTIPTRQFMDMWNGCFRVLIKFKIGEKVTLFDFHN
jgi:ABC-type bacteriocin/lantibiotic exporter with double-glycine peptidase domain